ncbi:MAG: hypothetical protein AAFZ49_07135, partial [Cyanobacteria bacterium J06659_2]
MPDDLYMPFDDPNNAARQLALAEEMMARGRSAAAIDGWHMIIWGVLVCWLLSLQYAADLANLAPGSLLWVWQPAALIGCIVSFFIGRHAAGRRQANVVSRLYTAAFVGAFICILIFMGASSLRDRPDPYTTSLVYHASMG